MTPDDEALALLREIRDNQRLQIERSAEVLAIQREQFETYKLQAERVAAFQGVARRVIFWVLVPMLALLFAMILWPYVVRLWP